MYAQAESWSPELILFPPVIDQHFMSPRARGKGKQTVLVAFPLLGDSSNSAARVGCGTRCFAALLHLG